MRKRESLVPFRDSANAARRKRLESVPHRWLRHYLPHRFDLPFCRDHGLIIDAAIRSITDGTSTTVAAARGFGKTSLLWGVAFYGVMTGLARFPVVIGWKKTAGAELMDQWLSELANNDILAADYPCVCDPFRESVQSKRLQSLLRTMEPDLYVGADVRKVRGLILLPATREPDGRELPPAALAGASINGSIKGLNVGLPSGEALRPDVALLDDPQDTETAQSDVLVAKVIKRIDYDLRSLSGPKRRIAMMAAVTVVEKDDVSERLLDRPGTDGIRTGQIESWPSGWGDKHSKSRDLWDEWNESRLDGLRAKDGGKAARAFYRKHKAALTRGMKVAWKHRRHMGDKKRPADPDAIFTAMWDFYDLGEEAFMAERQNRPIRQGSSLYELTADLIMSRTDRDRKAFEVPEWSKFVGIATDINHYGLHSSAAAFGNDQTAAVLWYDRFDRIKVPENAPESERRKIIFEMLVEHGKQIAALPIKPAAWMIDGRYQQDTVMRYAAGPARGIGPTIIVALGFNAMHYKPYGKNVIGKPREGFHVAEFRYGRGLAYNACYWREIAQRAWLGSIGAPGACSLFDGRHREFADQVASEKLIEKIPSKFGFVWRWGARPGWHDYGDAMTMLYLSAAWYGIGSGVAPTPAAVRRRSVRHIRV